MSKPVVAITIGKTQYRRMLSPNTLRELETFAHVIHHPGPDPANKLDLINLLPQADACITSWDVACLDDDVAAAAPRLKALAHMGGSVKRYLSRSMWERGIRVFSASPALAKDVAETTLGLIITGMKRIGPMSQVVRQGGWRESRFWPVREIHGKTIGIIGASEVGRHVISLLKMFDVQILVYDPYVSAAAVHKMGIEKVELDELVKRSDIISLHAPANAETHHMLDERRLKMMKDDALIVNTARGSLIDEKAFINELSNGRFFAILDVTDPEPPTPESPLRSLENVIVTPHLAGCIEDCTHMGEMAVEELRRFFNGEPPIREITLDMLQYIS